MGMTQPRWDGHTENSGGGSVPSCISASAVIIHVQHIKPDVMLQSMPGVIQQSMPGVMLQSMPGVVLQSMPGVILQSMPGVMLQSMPGVMLQSMPGVMLQSMPGVMLQSMPGVMLQRPTHDIRLCMPSPHPEPLLNARTRASEYQNPNIALI